MTDREQKIGYAYKNPALLETALTHSSYANEKHTESNERLEFLGDSVLSIIVSDYIFKNLAGKREGALTKIRASLVCEQSLAEISKKISLGEIMLLGRGEEMTGGRQRASIIADAFEAVLASIYLDGGFEAARKWLLNLMGDAIEDAINGNMYDDYKTMLQELIQKRRNSKIEYKIIAETGLDHNKRFEVAAVVDGRISGHGKGHSKKEAEQRAAHDALMFLKQ